MHLQKKRLPFNHSHRLILVALVLGIFLAGVYTQYFPASASGTLFGVIDRPQNGSIYEMGIEIPVNMEIRTDSPKYEAYIFAKLDGTPDTTPNSEDQIHYEVLSSSPATIKTSFKLDKSGQYTFIGFLNDREKTYLTRASTITVNDTTQPEQPTSNTTPAPQSSDAPPSTIGDSDSTGPGGAVAGADGEKELFGYSIAAQTLFEIPFHRPHVHGVESITIRSQNPTQQNAVILDNHNHTESIPDGYVYRYVDLTHTHPWEDDSIEFEMEFQVPRAWLLDYALGPANIQAYRFNNGEWEPIETYITRIENGITHYVARTDGIYPMALIGKHEQRCPFLCQLNPFEGFSWFVSNP